MWRCGSFHGLAYGCFEDRQDRQGRPRKVWRCGCAPCMIQTGFEKGEVWVPEAVATFWLSESKSAAVEWASRKFCNFFYHQNIEVKVTGLHSR